MKYVCQSVQAQLAWLNGQECDSLPLPVRVGLCLPGAAHYRTQGMDTAATLYREMGKLLKQATFRTAQ